MKAIKQTVFSGWHFMRWLRLGIGIFFVIQGLQTTDWLMGFVGAFFLFTSIANVGCCGGGTCAIRETAPRRRDQEA